MTTPLTPYDEIMLRKQREDATMDNVEPIKSSQPNLTQIVTPKGRIIDKQEGFNAAKLDPDYWTNLEAEEKARADRAERRNEGRRTGMLLADALKILADTYGTAKGANVRQRNPEDITNAYKELDNLEVQRVQMLDRIRSGKRAEQERELERAIQQDQFNKADQRYQKESDFQREQFEYGKTKDQENREYDSSENEKNRQSSEKMNEAANKTRLAAEREQTARSKYIHDTSTAPQGKTYKYTTPIAMRKTGNYSKLGADQSGVMNVEANDVAYFAAEILSEASQLEERVNQALKTSSKDWGSLSDKLAKLQSSPQYKAAERFITSSGSIDAGEVKAILDANMTPEKYLEMKNVQYDQEQPQAPEEVVQNKDISQLGPFKDLAGMIQYGQMQAREKRNAPQGTAKVQPVTQSVNDKTTAEPERRPLSMDRKELIGTDYMDMDNAADKKDKLASYISQVKQGKRLRKIPALPWREGEIKDPKVLDIAEELKQYAQNDANLQALEEKFVQKYKGKEIPIFGEGKKGFKFSRPEDTFLLLAYQLYNSDDKSYQEKIEKLLNPK